MIGRLFRWSGAAALAYAAALAFAALSATPAPSDTAIVLGNAVFRNGTPSPRLQARLDEALALFRHGVVRRILVSGAVERWNGMDEAQVMARYLERNGVPANAILQDPHGTNTQMTARDARALLGPDESVVAVSQWFHLPRTMLSLRAYGFRHVSGAWPRWWEDRDLPSFLREMVALPVYALRFARKAT
ncbi:YdcF family protein [Acetobacteraceae bacterium KSS8]|uniref:YdcF family protein n=1 Tax=Endosaccharibacter trunci TaxID=2812733 RepID=A0ABT1W3U8_9PROT|nr:YdcF family protein [Acetobacteraceae bacterium KSS8]